MRLEYTDQAVGDLVRVRQFIAEHDPEAARKIAALLFDGISLLQKQPRLGHPIALAPDPETIRDLVLRDYIVRYAITGQSILILRIWHHRESWK